MHPGIDSLITLDVHGDFRSRLQVLVHGGFVSSQVRPVHVIVPPYGHPLLKFTKTVGVNFPSGAFLSGAADLHRHSIHWVIIRSPNCTEDQGIVSWPAVLGR